MPIRGLLSCRRLRCFRPRSRRHLQPLNARAPVLIDGIVDYHPPRAVTDCVWLIPMPRLTSGGMKQGFVMSLLKSLFDAGDLHLAFIGSGNSAVVYDASDCRDDFLEVLLRMLTSPIVGQRIEVSAPIVLKFTIVTGVAAYEDAVRENTVHRYLSSVTALVHGRTLSVRKHVPTFYWAGYLSGWYITAMQRVQGETLQQRLTVGPLTSSQYDAVQRTFYDMWCLGVVHADAHLRNLVWTMDGCVMLDFGNALFLPSEYVSRLRAAYAQGGRLDAPTVWFAVLSLYVRSVIGSRGLRGFQPDGLLLASLRRAAG